MRLMLQTSSRGRFFKRTLAYWEFWEEYSSMWPNTTNDRLGGSSGKNMREMFRIVDKRTTYTGLQRNTYSVIVAEVSDGQFENKVFPFYFASCLTELIK